mmetsp:Transcript_1291/g.1365  ORF Transcript_1291/g.1365 Transcript_1291/m.1365 type:complete len:325 (+) Transcript_1291:248-1222(+)
MTVTHSYKYTPLNNLSVQKDVHIFGVIVGYSRPKSCRGSHKFSQTFQIMDNTLAHIQDAVNLIIFGNHIESFPPVLRVGDIIRCHRIRFNLYQERKQLIGWSGGNNPKSSCVVFRRITHDISCLPELMEGADTATATDLIGWDWASSSSSSISLISSDFHTCLHLQRWAEGFLSFSSLHRDGSEEPERRTGGGAGSDSSTRGTVGSVSLVNCSEHRNKSTPQRSLSQLSGAPSEPCDCVCLVMDRVSEPVEEDSGEEEERVLRVLVWDGTGGGNEGRGVLSVERVTQVLAKISGTLPPSSERGSVSEREKEEEREGKREGRMEN